MHEKWHIALSVQYPYEVQVSEHDVSHSVSCPVGQRAVMILIHTETVGQSESS